MRDHTAWPAGAFVSFNFQKDENGRASEKLTGNNLANANGANAPNRFHGHFIAAPNAFVKQLCARRGSTLPKFHFPLWALSCFCPHSGSVQRSLSLREREKIMTRNQQVREAQSARTLKSADQILAKYRAIGPAAVQAALCCAKSKAAAVVRKSK